MASEKFTKKYLKIAKLIGEESNPCHARKIGAIIVDPQSNKIVGTGYNGPPKGTKHTDDLEYLSDVVWPQLTKEEKEYSKCNDKYQFVNKYAGCKKCPRKVVGAPSGKRLELCSCAHAEANAIVNAAQDTYGCHMYCWCGVPCIECSKLIINAGINRVVCIDWSAINPGSGNANGGYSYSSRWLLQNAGVCIEMRDPDTLEII